MRKQSRTAKRAAAKAYMRKRRRLQWDRECQFCGDEWHNHKWSCFHEGSNTCTGCLQHLNALAKRGGAWIARRLVTLDVWTKRTSSRAPQRVRNGLKALAGGKR